MDNSTENMINGIEGAAKRGAKYNIESLNEDLLPTILVITEDNDVEVCSMKVEKDEMPVMLKQYLVDTQAKAYALVLEGWSTIFVESAKAYDYRIRDMPPDDRFEVANVIVVKRNEGIHKYLTSEIKTSPRNGKRQLQKWTDSTIRETRICVTEW